MIRSRPILPPRRQQSHADIEECRVTQRGLVEDFKYFLCKSIYQVLLENCASSENFLARVKTGRLIDTASFDVAQDFQTIETDFVDNFMARAKTGRSIITASADLAQDLTDFERIEPAFVVSSAGDIRVNGEWRCIEPGRFARIADSGAEMHWDEGSKHWQLLYGEELLYRLPSSGSTSILEGSWLAMQGKEPTPSLAAAGNRQQDRLVYYEVFARFWQKDPPFTGDEQIHDWTTIRGPYGESILSWLSALMSGEQQLSKVRCYYRSLMVWIIRLHPSLAGVRMIHEPFVGQTILHQACAASDVELVDFMVNSDEIRTQPKFNDEFLEVRLSGSFGQLAHKVPERLEGLVCAGTPMDDNREHNGPTPLEVACSAPKDDNKCAAIIHLLLKAGAMPIYYDQDGLVRYNLLHAVARSGWAHELHEAPLLSPARTKLLVTIFLDPNSPVCKRWGLEMRSQPNRNGYTPLQVAAMFGNEAAFCDLLDHFKVDVWEWGTKKEIGFPLAEIDSGASDDQICALELMTLHVHRNLLSLSVIADIVQRKWDLFGQLWVIRHLVVQMVSWTCTAIVCLEDTSDYSRLRYVARLCVLSLSCSYILFFLLVLALCAANEEWFLHMDWRVMQRNTTRVKFWSLLTVRSGTELFLMVLLVLVPPWYANGHVRAHSFYNFYWHVCASCFFMSGWTFVLRYLELFHITSALALAVPEVAKRDMVPFFVLFTIILLSCSVSLRIACELEETGQGDLSTFGSFVGVLKTLEEAIHGPDVQWRNAVEHRPALAGMIFVLFLWLTLIMVSLLIAMFSATFDVMKVKTTQQLMYRRAEFCITCEKLFPQWYYSHWSWGARGCKIGSKLGLNLADSGTLSKKSFRGRPDFDSYGSLDQTGISGGIDEDRWALWVASDENFDQKPLPC